MSGLSASTCLGIQISSGLYFTFSLFVLVYVTWKGLSGLYHPQSTMTLLFKVLFVLIICVAWVGSIAYVIYMSFAICVNEYLFNVASTISGFLYFTVVLPLLLITLTARLHYTFRLTVYKLKTCSLRFIIIGISFIIFCNCAFFVLYIDFYFFSKSEALFKYGQNLISLALMMYLILSCTVVAMFIRRLNELIMNRSRNPELSNSSRSISISRASSDPALSQPQKQLAKVVAKYLVVSFFAFGTSFITIIGLVILSSSPDTTIVLIFFRYIAYGDGVCNMICLYLQFGFAVDDYYRVCGICDRFIQNVIINKTKRTIMNELVKQASV